MRLRAFAGTAVSLVALAQPAAAQTVLTGLVTDLDVPVAGGPEAVATGDLDGDGRDEVAYVVRNGRLTSDPDFGSVDTSTLMVFRVDGGSEAALTPLWQAQGAEPFIGQPAIADFDGDNYGEVAVCELAQAGGACRVYDGDGSELTHMRMDGLHYAGMAHGGPTAADLNDDGFADLVVGTYAGEVRVKWGSAGTCTGCPSDWTYDLWANHSDWIFGHVAVGDVTGDGQPNIVVGGTASGAFYVLDRFGSLVAASPARYDASSDEGHFYFGSGPTLVDLDDDGVLEVVSLLDYYSDSGDIDYPMLVVDEVVGGATVVLGEEPMPASASYTNAVSADVGGDGSPELIVLDNEGVLRTFAFDAAAATLEAAIVPGSTHAFGAQSWTSPALVDADADGDVEIALGTTDGAYLLDESLGVLALWSSPSSHVYPAPAIGEVDGDGKAELLTGTWSPPQIAAIDLPYTYSGSWSGLNGGDGRTGSIGSSADGVLVTDNPAVETAVIVSALAQLVEDPGDCRDADLVSARNQADLAHRNYLRGDPHLSVDRLRRAIEELIDAEAGACSTDYWQQRIAQTADQELSQHIDRATVVLGGSHSAIVAAQAGYVLGAADLAAKDYLAATVHYDDAAEDLRSALDAGGYGVSNDCPAGSKERFQHWLCEAVAAYEDALAANVNSRITNAMRGYIVWMPDLVLGEALAQGRTAAFWMGWFSVPEDIEDRFATAALRTTRIYLNNASVWFGDLDPEALEEAEAAYSDAESVIEGGTSSYYGAFGDLVDAYDNAKPCGSDSWGSNAAGLEGGGCSP